MTETIWDRMYGFDIETYPNVFTCVIKHASTGTRWIYEVSDRGNQAQELVDFMMRLRECGCRMIGFNNQGFDYPVLHHIASSVTATGGVTVEEIYKKANAIIYSAFNDYSHNVWESDMIVPQIDLYKIKHFDNMARSTSLKMLEINMRASHVEDLPYKPGTSLVLEQIDPLIVYNCHDVDMTLEFAAKNQREIEFRDELTSRYGKNFTNYNDTRIGKQHFINELEANGIACYERLNGRRMPRQTPRHGGIVMADRVMNVPFVHDDLRRIHSFFKGVTIDPLETKGFFKGLTSTVDDFTFVFGAGGIHGSVHGRTFHESDTHAIVDVDVTSYYPSIAIVNGWYPEHLGAQFCSIYGGLKQQRTSYAKGTAENAMLKLALNGVYGDSNNKYSPFYDPAYTMTVTINGQLLLAWLAEMVMQIEGAELIQVNTDGLTVHLPRGKRSELDAACATWEKFTRMDLEHVDYKSMFVRDVNNYIAVDTNGKVKRKNAYLTEPDWHQDHSSLVVQKAVSAALIDGVDPTEFIYNHTDPYDFMRRVKIPKKGRLYCGDDQVQNTSRYYIALAGRPLKKVMLQKGATDETTTSIDKDWNVQMCNVASDFDWANLNRRFYINEAKKLINGVSSNEQ